MNLVFGIFNVFNKNPSNHPSVHPFIHTSVKWNQCEWVSCCDSLQFSLILSLIKAKNKESFALVFLHNFLGVLVSLFVFLRICVSICWAVNCQTQFGFYSCLVLPATWVGKFITYIKVVVLACHLTMEQFHVPGRLARLLAQVGLSNTCCQQLISATCTTLRKWQCFVIHSLWTFPITPYAAGIWLLEEICSTFQNFIPRA